MTDVAEKKVGLFGRYRLLGPLASGGMAIVYRAVLDGPSGFQKQMAIKRMRPDLASDAGFRTMLLDEALLSARLHHPNIVQVVECGEVEGELYIAMELIEGCDLRAIFTRCRELNRFIPPAICAYLVASLASALEYAHRLEGERGKLLLVHRDVSPTNVMLTQQGTVKLLDFGIAKAAVMLRDDETRTGVVKGKFSYMSPEQAGGLDIDSRSDLFSLGVVLYEALTLRAPFRGANDLATLRLVREAKFEPVSQVVPGVSAIWDTVVARLLAPDPAHRYQSGREVEQELVALAGSRGNASATKAFIESLSLGPRSDQQLPATGSAMVSSSKTTDPTVELDIDASELEPRRRSRTVPALVGGVALVVAAGFALWPRAQPSVTPVGPAPEGVPAVVAAPSPEPAPAASVPAAAVPAAAVPAAALVVVEVRGPKGAMVTIDEVAAGRAPLVAQLPVRGETRHVRIEREGFQAFERSVPGNSSVVIEAALKPNGGKRADKRAPKATPVGEVSDPFR